MRQYKRHEIEAALERMGFALGQGSHSFFVLYVDGRKTSVRTMLSHGAREYGDALLGQVRKQLRLQAGKELQGFLDGTMTREAYIALLLDRGHLRLPEASPSN